MWQAPWTLFLHQACLQKHEKLALLLFKVNLQKIAETFVCVDYYCTMYVFHSEDGRPKHDLFVRSFMPWCFGRDLGILIFPGSP